MKSQKFPENLTTHSERYDNEAMKKYRNVLQKCVSSLQKFEKGDSNDALDFEKEVEKIPIIGLNSSEEVQNKKCVSEHKSANVYFFAQTNRGKEI